MKTKIILMFSAVIYLLRAIGLLFSPAQLYQMYGTPMDAAGLWSAQLMGASMLFIFLMNWMAARDQNNPFVKKVIAANVIYSMMAVLIAIKGIPLFNSLIFLAIGLDSLLLLLFIYILLSRSEVKNS
jgi:hypothetical protein